MWVVACGLNVWVTLLSPTIGDAGSWYDSFKRTYMVLKFSFFERELKRTKNPIIPIFMCRGTRVWSFRWISVCWSHRGRLGCRSYLANVLVVAACVLLLQEKLVPHPTSSHSFEQLLSSECFRCSLSIQFQSIQRQAQTENTEHGQ